MNRMGYKQVDYTAKTMLEEISQIVPFFAGVKWENLGDNGKQCSCWMAHGYTDIASYRVQNEAKVSLSSANM